MERFQSKIEISYHLLVNHWYTILLYFQESNAEDDEGSLFAKGSYQTTGVMLYIANNSMTKR